MRIELTDEIRALIDRARMRSNLWPLPVMADSVHRLEYADGSHYWAATNKRGECEMTYAAADSVAILDAAATLQEVLK